MRVLSLIAALLVGDPSAGADVRNRIIDLCPSPPPREYRQTPTVDYKISAWPVEWIDGMCAGTGVQRYPVGLIDACAVRLDDEYAIYLRNDFKPFARWCAIEHEKGHLPPNNWKHPPANSYKDANGTWQQRLGPFYRRPADFAADEPRRRRMIDR
jgi:hypothetical protein